MRAMIAPGAAAVAIAGMIRWASRSSKPPAPREEYMPRLGSQRRLIAKNTISTRPSQKGGMLPMTSEAPIAARSTTVCCREAASTPTATPPTTASTKLAPARIRVLPNLGSSSSTTGLCTMGERPRSPCSARHSHFAYCTWMAWSSPRAWRSWASDWSLAIGPSSARATSPGMSFMVRKITTVMPNSTGTRPSRRWST